MRSPMIPSLILSIQRPPIAGVFLGLCFSCLDFSNSWAKNSIFLQYSAKLEMENLWVLLCFILKKGTYLIQHFCV